MKSPPRGSWREVFPRSIRNSASAIGIVEVAFAIPLECPTGGSSSEYKEKHELPPGGMTGVAGARPPILLRRKNPPPLRILIDNPTDTTRKIEIRNRNRTRHHGDNLRTIIPGAVRLRAIPPAAARGGLQDPANTAGAAENGGARPIPAP